MANLAELLGDLDEEAVLEAIDEVVAANGDGLAAVAELQKGMDKVGELFENGEYFVGDLIFAGEILTEAIGKLKPILSAGTGDKMGSIVLGTVHGDLHDIGKNIFKNMVEIAGFEVYDLGIDQSPEAFVEKIKEVKPVIVGMSGVLTLALDSMKDTVDAIKAAGLRDNVKIIIGGNPVTKEACEQIGADAFTTNAAEGVKICKAWV
ncbi:MAG: cobalamin-dependent protein [Eubacteriaceae bacterium]|nr:cobalamin-dependent protein [Eubacteriaceae bacterium]MCR4894284.1 cobalamin-dependent protein [Eubacteriales bacterium]